MKVLATAVKKQKVVVDESSSDSAPDDGTGSEGAPKAMRKRITVMKDATKARKKDKKKKDKKVTNAIKDKKPEKVRTHDWRNNPVAKAMLKRPASAARPRF